MKKLFFIAFALMLSFTTALAEKKDVPKEEPSAKGLEQDRGGGGGEGNGSYQYRFVSFCGEPHLLTVDHKLSENEYAYWKGYYDGLCLKNIFYASLL